MKKGFDRVYQFKITLQGIEPPIWRRVQVPETYTFGDLHAAIQDAMGWQDYHLHRFDAVDPATGRQVEIGIPFEDFGEPSVRPEWAQRIADYFVPGNKSMDYVYDFGDDWHHTVELEAILDREQDATYPLCIAGERACPPEDCGAAWGYEDLLETLEDPSVEGYEEAREWVGDGFDPEHFDVDEVRFIDPARHRHAGFG